MFVKTWLTVELAATGAWEAAGVVPESAAKEIRSKASFTVEEVEERERQRGLTVQARADGSAKLSGQLTAECTELLLTHLDAFARPKPAVDGVQDPRSAAQRRHDALLDALKLNLRARLLPRVAGVTATLVMTMTAQEFATRRGLARTGHGALIPVPEAIRMAAAEYRLLNVVLDKTKGITAYSSTQRLHTEQQRPALTRSTLEPATRNPPPTR